VGLRKRLSQTMEEIEQERLQGRVAELDLPPLAEMPCRRRVQVAGEITVERIRPRSGIPSYEVVVSDGTGEVVAVFTGRHTVKGMTTGSAVILDGVAHQEHGRRVMLNPAYTLLPRAHD
jgi:hypothetical protein